MLYDKVITFDVTDPPYSLHWGLGDVRDQYLVPVRANSLAENLNLLVNPTKVLSFSSLIKTIMQRRQIISASEVQL